MFIGWNYLGKEYDFSSKVDSDIALDAIWEKNGTKYNVTFKVDDFEKILELSIVTKDTITALEVKEKEEYKIRWYLDDKECVFPLKVEEDITIVGKSKVYCG